MFLWLIGLLLGITTGVAAPVKFHIPSQPASAALHQFAKQAGREVLFSAETVRELRSHDVNGAYEPVEAMRILLVGTGLLVETTPRGGFLIKPALRAESRAGPARPEVTLAPGWIETQQLDPITVAGEKGAGVYDYEAMSAGPRSATSNLDLPRSEDGALPFTVYRRKQIARSGVVSLSEFLRREMLDGDAIGKPPEKAGGLAGFVNNVSNLGMRGYSPDETVVLINGRRLPEMVTSSEASPMPPDVNFIPLSLVDQIQVLPSSASAIYGGNPVGGVINIITRPDALASATEVSTTYTNSTGGYDAPQTAFSLLHSRSLLGGKLRVRIAANANETEPPTESELRLHRDRSVNATTGALYGSTPNVRSVDRGGLFGTNSSAFTSVAPGADGTGGLLPFLNRQGVRAADDFDTPAGMATSVVSHDYAYGLRQSNRSLMGAVLYDPTPWLQVGVDAVYSRSVWNRGLEVIARDLLVPASAPTNPFGKDVMVSLNEAATELGENYSEAHLTFSSVVLGVLLRPASHWRLSLDLQYAHNITEVRGLYGADVDRWQQLIATGQYNPFRDTQRFPAPEAFYDQVLVYKGGRDQFVRVGDYRTIDISGRITQTALELPMGRSVLNIGGDYRLNHLDSFNEDPRFGDGSVAYEADRWGARTIQRYSVFGEWQGPIYPVRRLPRFLRSAEADLAVRYIAADSSKESNFAPTMALKFAFQGGFALRTSVTYSSRYPSPYMSRRVAKPNPNTGAGVSYANISDSLRGDEKYTVIETPLVDPNLSPESSVTQSFGVSWEKGHHHRMRIAADLLDTRKDNELVYLDPSNALNVEDVFPDRVVRLASSPLDGQQPGRVVSVFTGTTNLAWRRSQSVNLGVNYRWDQCLGGLLETYFRSVSYLSYSRQLLPTRPEIDELADPSGADNGLLKHRAAFGLSWSRNGTTAGLNGYYYHSRKLPASQHSNQGSDHVASFTQYDVFLQQELDRWLPWKSERWGLRAQFRVNNLFGTEYPHYANEPNGSGVQAYGDWRGRVYSFNLTASF